MPGSETQLQSALERACQFHRFGSDDIRSILAAGGWAPPARAELGERLVLRGLPKVPAAT